MALLVNYEGTYLPPQKLWYLVDGVWKEVVNVFESTVQQDIAILDQNRIKQDQVVNALGSKATELLAKIDGSDPTIPIETDPAKIEDILKEFEILNLQLEVAKTEQVVLTKYLFEQKAQMEYIKLVSEGEQALEKIATLVTNPVEWQVIRIAPQSTLDERLEIAIQHGLDTNDRIFNYGLVYYRLFKVSGNDPNDDLEYLKEQFKRRLNKVAFDAGTEPTNYIFTVDSIQNVYIEVNAFVNSGAKRIEDYLASVKDQQKYILDKIEDAKVAMATLEEKVVAGDIVKVDGMIQTISSKPELVVPLGLNLLQYQNVTSFQQLVSTSTLQDIASGTKQVEDFPGVVKLNNDANSLNEKLQSIQDFQTLNGEIQNDLVTGNYVFDLNVFSIKKNTLSQTKNLFWSNPLGETGITSGRILFTQTYTSNGTYKFTTNELVSLHTNYVNIISTMLANTKIGTLGVTIGNIPAVRIIQSIEANTIILDKNDIDVEKETTSVNIISRVTSNVKNTGPLLASFKTIDYGNRIVSVSETNLVDETNGINQYLNCIKVNQNDQPHPAIPFVYKNNLYTVEFPIQLDIEHPVINSLFYATTYEYPLNSLTSVNVEPYLYEFGIRQLNKDFGVATLVPPTLNIGTDNIAPRETFISVFKECSYENTISLSSPTQMPLIDGGLIKYPIVSFLSCSAEKEVTLSLPSPEATTENLRWFIINAVHQPLSSQMESSVKLFNIREDNISIDKLNGYQQKTNYITTGTSGTGIIKIKLVDQFDHDNYNEYNSLLKEKISFEDNSTKYFTLSKQDHNYLSSQTGLVIGETFDIEFINTLIGSAPKISSMTGVGSIDLFGEHTEYINAVTKTNPLISTKTSNQLFDTTNNENSLYENINVLPNVAPLITTITSESIYSPMSTNDGDYLDKDVSKIPALARHLNPGIILD